MTPLRRRAARGLAITLILVGTTALTPLTRAAEGLFANLAPLERQPTQLASFATANQVPETVVQLTFGLSQTEPGQGPGTGNQIYYFGAEYGVTKNLSFGLWAEAYEDPVLDPINGLRPEVDMDNIAGFAQYQVYDGTALDIAVKASVERMRLASDIWGSGSGSDAEQVIGSIAAPVTYQMNPALQFHLTPGVSIFPETVNGFDFYGVVPFLGAGASYRFSNRFAAYANVTVPFGPGGNVVTDTSTIDRVAIWAVGGRFNVTPKAALDLYLTNGIGTTPATRILGHWPEGDDLLIGAKLTWTPGEFNGLRSSYQPLRTLTAREISLQRNGFTLPSVDTYEPGTLAGRAWYGSGDNYGVGLALAPDQHGQVEFYAESYSDDGSVPAGLLPSNADERYMVGAKLRFLDQNLGDPFSFSARLLGGRDLDTNAAGNGVLYGEAIVGYKVSPRVAVTAVGKVAAFGNNEYYGLGLGANFELFEGLELIGEVTPTDGANGTVWAAGARYTIGQSGWSVDAHASNAIGHNGLGSMIAQDDVKYALSVTKTLDLSGWR